MVLNKLSINNRDTYIAFNRGEHGMRIFEPQENLTSYKYPITKMSICVSICFLIFYINKYSVFNRELVDTLMKTCGVLLVCPTIYCIYVSIVEIEHVHRFRKVMYKRRNTHTMAYSIEAIVNLLSENDIIEIEIDYCGEIIKIGTSATCCWPGGELTDKLYYVGNREYRMIDELTKELNGFTTSGCISVQSIDGIEPF